jgi:transcriptional regulator of acetoin/glycerol metabolism
MPNRLQVAHAERISVAVRDGSSDPSTEDRLLKSWRRSLEDYGLDPGRPGEPRILPASRLRERLEPLDAFMRIARHGVRRLHEQVRDANYIVLLTDAQGIALDFMGTPALDKPLRRAGLYLGSNWSESSQGTCGIGTAIVDRAPILIHKDEHFRAPHISLTCSAAPIFDASGDLLAVLDGSALDSPNEKRSQALLYHLVKQHALMIEDAYFLDCTRNAWVLQLTRAAEFVDVRTDALLALDDDGRTIAANRRARELLPALGTGANANIAQLFDATMEDLVRRGMARPGLGFAVRDTGGSPPLHARMRAPERIAALEARPRATTHVSVRQPLPPALRELALDDQRMQENVRRAARLVNARIPILLQGETGTGKEAFARALHQTSTRAANAFVAVNCAAIPETLIESELFGYRDGAFTGARTKGMRGKIVQSSGGTLFLDEIGDMPLELQSRLLRVLAEHEVVPLGAEAPIKVDLSVICATHHDLPALVRGRQFREDLYYRLNAATFDLPPLRERDDIDSLIGRIFRQEADAAGRSLALDPKLLARLVDYRWPGNIRELRNAMRYAVAVCESDTVKLVDLPANLVHGVSLTPPTDAPPDPRDTPGSGARETLVAALRRNQWNAAGTARELGIARATLYRQMARLRIIPPNRRDSG